MYFTVDICDEKLVLTHYDREYSISIVVPELLKNVYKRRYGCIYKAQSFDKIIKAAREKGYGRKTIVETVSGFLGRSVGLEEALRILEEQKKAFDKELREKKRLLRRLLRLADSATCVAYGNVIDEVYNQLSMVALLALAGLRRNDNIEYIECGECTVSYAFTDNALFLITADGKVHWWTKPNDLEFMAHEKGVAIVASYGPVCDIVKTVAALATALLEISRDCLCEGLAEKILDTVLVKLADRTEPGAYIEAKKIVRLAEKAEKKIAARRKMPG